MCLFEDVKEFHHFYCGDPLSFFDLGIGYLHPLERAHCNDHVPKFFSCEKDKEKKCSGIVANNLSDNPYSKELFGQLVNRTLKGLNNQDKKNLGSSEEFNNAWMELIDHEKELKKLFDPYAPRYDS